MTRRGRELGGDRVGGRGREKCLAILREGGRGDKEGSRFKRGKGKRKGKWPHWKRGRIKRRWKKQGGNEVKGRSEVGNRE